MGQEGPRITSRQTDESGRVTLGIANLTEEEAERVAGVLNGHWRMSAREDGQLEFVPARDPLPAPAEDAQLAPYWPRRAPGDVQMKLFREARIDTTFCASIVIQYLCGYFYTPENYKIQAELLESYGFSCLRSRRKDNGRYWEIWCLSSLRAAKGDFRKHIDPTGAMRYTGGPAKERERLDTAIHFLCKNVSFGTLDVNVQRAAMEID